MNEEEAILYLEHTGKDDFNLEEHQTQNRLKAIQFIINKNKQLESNWKELKKWVEEEIKHLEKSRYISFNEYGENKLRISKDFLYKMQELESNND